MILGQVTLETDGLIPTLLATIVVVGLMAFVSGRVLGIRRGWRRAATASLIGWVAGVTIAALTAGPDGTDDLLGLALLFGVLATMFASVGIELLLHPFDGTGHRGRSRLGVLLHPGRAVSTKLEPIRRGRQIMGLARSHGLLHVRFANASALDDPQLGEILRDTLQDCGGMFVKFGQIASTRADLLPPSITEPLADLRSDVRPAERAEVEAALEADLGQPITDVFASFDWEPLAAASIGQTYRATLRDGTPVVVKVRRPGIEDVVARDGRALLSLASFVETRTPLRGRARVRDLAAELVGNVTLELDYLREATNGMRLAHNRADDEGITVPGVHLEHSSGRVLVMDEVDGRSIDAPGAITDGEKDGPELARNLLRSFLGQILQDGFYHADPHPGNVFVDRQGTLHLIDFGSVGVLDPRLLGGLQVMALGVTLRDPSVLVRALLRIGSAQLDTDRRALEGDVSRLLGDQVDQGFDASSMREVLEVMSRHGLGIPDAFVVLSRALVTLEGTLRLLDPTFQMGAEAKAVVSEWYGGSEGLEDREMLVREATRAALTLRDLPGQIDDLANMALAGKLKIATSRYGGENDHEAVDSWVNRAIVAAIGGVGLLVGALMMVGAALAHDDQLALTLQVLGYFSLGTGSVLSMRAVARALGRRT